MIKIKFITVIVILGILIVIGMISIKEYRLFANTKMPSHNSLITQGPAITLWFDDAWISQYTIAYPIMRELGFVGAIAVPTNFIEGAGIMSFIHYKVTAKDFMTWEQLVEMKNHGWEITSHTKSHSCDLDFYKPPVLGEEFLESKLILQAKGFKINNFVMPCGTWANNAFLPNEAKKYYDSYRSLQPATNPIPLINPYDIRAYFISNQTKFSEILEWINQVKKEKSWLIITFHIIDDSHQKYAITPTLFKLVLQAIKDETIPVVLPNQVILSYKKNHERNNHDH